LSSKNPSNEKEQFIKRVIGLPGDKVAIIQGVVYVNDQPVQEEYTLARCGALVLLPPRSVPENTYFVLGDNRNNSEEQPFFPRWLSSS